MPIFAGMVHEYLEPLPITFAEIEANRLIIRYGSWTFEATSRDGFQYEGNYGEGQADPDLILRCWVYPGSDGSKVVFTYSYNRNDPQLQAESVFRLFPSPRPAGSVEELPVDWALATRALESRPQLTRAVPLKLILVHDRWTGYRTHQDALSQAGLYILFYPSGRIARVGQAGRSLARRLPDYEPNKDGWFCFRWVGVIPVAADKQSIITPLEDYLLATLRPPENTRGVGRSGS